MGTAEGAPGDEHALRERDVGKDRAQGKAHAEDSVWRSVILSNANYLASLLAALTINLALPLVMSKGQFADVRAFLLFAGFGGLLHFGLLDGFYLTVVGTRLSDVSIGFVRSVRRVVFALQLAVVGSVMLLVRLSPAFQAHQRIAIPAVLFATYHDLLRDDLRLPAPGHWAVPPLRRGRGRRPRSPPWRASSAWLRSVGNRMPRSPPSTSSARRSPS